MFTSKLKHCVFHLIQNFHVFVQQLKKSNLFYKKSDLKNHKQDFYPAF